MSIQSEILPLRTLGKACHEDALERCCSVVCGLRPDIVEVAEQPPAISYIDDAGRHRLFGRSSPHPCKKSALDLSARPRAGVVSIGHGCEFGSSMPISEA